MLDFTTSIGQEIARRLQWEQIIKKYAAGIKSLGMTPEAMLGEYAAVLLVTPTALRRF